MFIATAVAIYSIGHRLRTFQGRSYVVVTGAAAASHIFLRRRQSYLCD